MLSTASAKCRRTPSGFTLVELLVVIAIIALLISILLPSLARAREQAKEVTCLANLKDLGSAAHIYATSDDGDYLVPMHWRAVAPIFDPGGGAPGGPTGAYLQGDIQWGGKGGDPRLFNADNGSDYANKWAFTHAFEYGPGDRPLNKIIYKSIGNAGWSDYTPNLPGRTNANMNESNLAAAIQDSEVDLPVYHCPSDIGWESGKAGAYYLDGGYVVKSRGFDEGLSHYDMTGNSYKNSMNWLRDGSNWYSTTVWATPADRVHTPSRLVMWTEGNAEDTAYWNRPELIDNTDVPAEWWVQGWHQGDGEIMVFNTNYADGHASKMEQKVRSTYSSYQSAGDGTEFTSGDPRMRGSRPERVVTPYGWGTAAEGNLGWWGDKLYRGEGWAIDNLPAPPQFVMPTSG